MLHTPASQFRVFPVDPVTPATEPLPPISLRSVFDQRLHRECLAMSGPELPIVAAEHHPLIEAVGIAYAQHHHLVLSPDHIWLTIAQGFGHHITLNAEKFRHRLARHSGKKTLSNLVFGSDLADWRAGIANFSAQIQAATDPVIHETLVCDFSTSEADARTASEIVLMDTFSEYFDYRAIVICGIPTITILGTPEDWQRIRARAEVLSTFDLEWWAIRLRPVLDEFVKASEGEVSEHFWQTIYSSVPTYHVPCKPPSKTPTGHAITGWIADLVPYLGNGRRRRRNVIFHNSRENWQQTQGGVAPQAFPPGYSIVDVKCANHPDVKFLAGLLGVTQRPSDLAVSPAIGWAVLEANENPDVKARAKEELLSRAAKLGIGHRKAN
jgi:hypothetical protein